MKNYCFYIINFIKKQVLERSLEWLFILPLMFFLGTLSAIIWGYVDWDTRRSSAEKEIQTMRTNFEEEISQKKNSAEKEYKEKQTVYAKEISYLDTTKSETLKKYESAKKLLAEIEVKIQSKQNKLNEIELLEKQIEDLLKQKNTLDSSVLNLSKEKNNTLRKHRELCETRSRNKGDIGRFIDTSNKTIRRTETFRNVKKRKR